MRLCKIHLCHHVYKLLFVLLQSKTEQFWLWVQVRSGAKLNNEVYLLFFHRKPCRVFVVSTLQILEQLSLNLIKGLLSLNIYICVVKVYTVDLHTCIPVYYHQSTFMTWKDSTSLDFICHYKTCRVRECVF